MDTYLSKWNPFRLREERVREQHRLLHAARAYDYAFWMGAGFLLPEVFATPDRT